MGKNKMKITRIHRTSSTRGDRQRRGKPAFRTFFCLEDRKQQMMNNLFPASYRRLLILLKHIPLSHLELLIGGDADSVGDGLDRSEGPARAWKHFLVSKV